MLLMSRFTDKKTGKCYLGNHPSQTFKQDPELIIKELIIENCPGCKFIGKIEVKGHSKKENKIIDKDKLTTYPLILVKDSPKINFDEVYVEGLLSLDDIHNESSDLIKIGKKQWKKWVPNGVDIRSKGITIKKLIAKNVHHSIQIQESHCTIENMHTDTYSGDDGQILASYTTIKKSVTKNAIKIFPYAICHRDVKQIYPPGNNKKDKTISNISILNQKYRDGDGAYSQTPDGIIMHTDGILKNSTMKNIDVYTNKFGKEKEISGVSSVSANNCFVKITQLKASGGELHVHFLMKKGSANKPQIPSINNTFCAPDGYDFDILFDDSPNENEQNVIACIV